MVKKLWGGRFTKNTDPLVEEFTKSIDYDYKLAKYDLLGSLLHVSVLKSSGFITGIEAKKLTHALERIYKKVEKNLFKFDKSSEDIHTAIQNAVEYDIGSLALKLHTARSRNDQVLLDLKLFCNAELGNIQGLCVKLMESLQKAAKNVKKTIIPGYTHMQHAQLIYLADYLKSYIEMLKRDEARISDIKNNIKFTSGAGALAGTPIAAKHYKKKIGPINFVPTTNSIDTVSNRDFVIEILSCLSVVGMHLSRFSEDLIIWSTKEFNFVEIDDAFATGSSLMPQKKNADILELIRGYCGTLYGNLLNVLTVMKGLPLSYNRDMQLDKEPLFASIDIVTKELKILTKLIGKLKWNKKEIEEKVVGNETLYATDLVYHLVKKGIPFKNAHDIIGKLVTASLKSGKRIKDMKDKELHKFSGKLKISEIKKILNPEVSVKSRISVKRG